MVDYHPFSDDVYRDPFPIYRRLRDEAPAFYLEEFDCWFLSRFEDVWTQLQDQQHLTTTHGTTTTHLLTRQTQTSAASATVTPSVKIRRSRFRQPAGLLIMVYPSCHRLKARHSLPGFF